MMYWNGDMGLWGYILMGSTFVLFWGAVITGIVLFSRSVGDSVGRSGQLPVSRTAEDVLAERFAAGEIDEAEYRSRIAVLQGWVGPLNVGSRS